MPTQWRGRATALAVAASILAIGAALGPGAVGRSDPALTVARPDGSVMERVSLPADGTFTLRYRNSLYGTLAEERFAVGDAGVIRLVDLAAEQLAVLEEYYAIQAAASRRADGAWTAEPAHVPHTTSLRVAATDRGERTLLVDGHPPIELWRLVDDGSPTVVIELDG